MLRIPVIFLLALAFLISCTDRSVDRPPVISELDSITVDLGITYQSISGFGGCNSVFRGASNYPNAEDMQKAFGTGEDELGFTIFRVSIPPNSTNWSAIAEVSLLAQDLDAIVFASPWDAPDEFLDPNEEERVILPSMYGAYVDHLNEFNSFMSSYGVNLHAISVQNEPDIGEWTQWTPGAVQSFMRDYAGGINNRVITPESFNFNRVYYTSLLADPDATANIDIVGGHIYGGGLGDIPAARQQGKEIWMTEYLLNEFTDNISEDSWTALTESQKWNQSMEMLNTVHESMLSNWNAYIWWYLKRYYSFIGDGLEGSQDGEILKRGYAFSHFSKFVRPGYVRVDAKHRQLSNLQVTAFEGEDKVVVQIINPTTSITSKFKIVILGLEATSAMAYMTNENSNRETLAVEFEEGEAVLRVQAKSITTVILEI